MEKANMRYPFLHQLLCECEEDYLTTATDSDATRYRQCSHAEKVKLLQRNCGAKFAEAGGYGRWATQATLLRRTRRASQTPIPGTSLRILA